MLGRGPFGNAIRIVNEPDLNFRPFLGVPRARLHDSPLDLKGAGRSVSVVVWAIRESGNHALAGVWHEGTDLRQASTANIRRVERGQRQYALSAGLNIEGSACGHLSESGASSFLNRYALHKCNSAGVSPAVPADAPANVLDAAWQCFAMTFDHERQELTGWLNGVAGDRWLEDPKNDRIIASADHAYMQGHWHRLPGLQPGEDPDFPPDQFYNPPEDTPVSVKVLAETAAERIELREYRYTKVRLTLRKTANGAFAEASRDLVALRLNPWWYPHAIYAPPAEGSGGPFTIGRVIHSSRTVGFTGWIGGVAVFNRALTAEELARLTRIASLATGAPSGVSLQEVDAAREALALYRAELDKFRKEFAVSDRVPEVPFFLFGMGARAKHWYGQPVPNLFVYPKPWLRDAAMMGMAFEATGNLPVIRDWVLGLRAVYDRNNAGEEEADNPGQALYLISLVSDRTHPLVEDSYSALFWWDYREAHVPGSDARDRGHYPYLGWAVDHFYGEKGSPISNRDYPLTWEQRASQADYPKLEVLDPAFAREKIATPHTWHAAEVFLYLLKQDREF